MPQFTTPVGRLVWGHPLKMTAKLGDDGKPKVPQELITSFGVAYPKADFIAHIWPQMQAAAQSAYGAEQVPGHFAWKYADGDAATGHRKGKPYNQRDGYPGNYVLKFETQFPIQAFRQNAQGTWDQITERDMKTGDYIAVSVNMEGHKPKTANATPGLYTNPNGVLLIGIGDAISGAPDAATMFGGQQFALPPGAQAPGSVPTMQPGVNPPGMQQPPGMPAPPMQPAAPHYAPQLGAPMTPQTGYAAPTQGGPNPAYQPAYDIAGGQPPQNPMQPGGYAPTPGYPVAPGYAAPVQPGMPGAPNGGVTYPSSPGAPQIPGQAPMPGFPGR
jgi:hypothetical protein